MPKVLNLDDARNKKRAQLIAEMRSFNPNWRAPESVQAKARESFLRYLNEANTLFCMSEKDWSTFSKKHDISGVGLRSWRKGGGCPLTRMNAITKELADFLEKDECIAKKDSRK